MPDYTLAAEAEQDLSELCRDFADREIAGRAPAAWERAECPTDLLREMGQLGLLGMLIPEEWGGIGMTTVGFVAALERLGHRALLLTVGDEEPDVPELLASYHLGGTDAWHRLQTLAVA